MGSLGPLVFIFMNLKFFCIYLLSFSVSAAALYQENKTQTNFPLLSLSVYHSQMFSMFLIFFHDVHTVQLWHVSMASLCALVDCSAVRWWDVMTRTSCGRIHLTMKSRQRISWLCLFALCGAMVFCRSIYRNMFPTLKCDMSLCFIFLMKPCGRNIEWERVNTVYVTFSMESFN